MTEFALIVPIFLLIVAGLLAFGRVFFYWIEANHMASETARWAVVDRNPYGHRPDAPAARGDRRSTAEFADDVNVCIDFPGKTRQSVELGDPVSVQDPEAVQLRADPRDRADHHPRHLDDADRELRGTATTPTYDGRPTTSGRAHEPPACSDERGAVLVMAAVMIPVFLLLTALVVDVGNWYTHKRQLQNRADAAAFAAGVEYAKNWKACVQTGDADAAASTARCDRRRRAPVRGRPRGVRLHRRQRCRRRSATPRSRTRRTSTSSSTRTTRTTPTTPTTRTAGGSPTAGRPVLPAPPATTSRRPGHWTDVRVKERDLPSLFGPVGLPLVAKWRARSRRDQAGDRAAHRFLPLAVPNNVITKVQVRYYNECKSPAELLWTYDLVPLDPDYHGGVRRPGGGTLWGLDNDPNSGGDTVTLPTYGVRLAHSATPATCTRPAMTSRRPVTGRTCASRSATCRRSSARSGSRSRATAPGRAIEIRPAISGHRFLPLAVPNNVITQVQVRYYNECTIASAELLCDARPRAAPDGDYQGAVPGRRDALGAPERDPSVGDRDQGSASRCRRYGGCGQAYLPARRRGADREPRRDRPRHNYRARSSSRCSTPTASTGSPRSASGTTATPNNQVRIGDVHLTGGCGNTRRVLRHAARAATDCRFGANVVRQLGRPDDGDLDVPRQLQRQGERRRLPTRQGPRADGRRIQPLDACPATRSPRTRAPTR